MILEQCLFLFTYIEGIAFRFVDILFIHHHAMPNKSIFRAISMRAKKNGDRDGLRDEERQ